MPPIAAPDSYAFRAGRPIYAGLTDPASVGVADLTTVVAQSLYGAAQASVPMTFGHPFKAGDFDHATQSLQLVATGLTADVQIDRVASHPNGTCRFAALSAIVPLATAGGDHAFTLRTVPKVVPAVAALPSTPDWNITVDATVYRRQVTRLRLGNRISGGFLTGETITLTLTMGSVVEEYTHTVTALQEGTGFDKGQLIATEFAAAINAASPTWKVERIGSVYERMFFLTRDPAAPAFTLATTYAGTAVLIVSNDFDYLGVPEVWRAQAQSDLLAMVADHNDGLPVPRRKMHGHVATEFEIVKPLVNVTTAAVHPHLTARFHVRIYSNGAIRTDAVIENNWTFKPNTRKVYYSTEIRHGSTVLHAQTEFGHHYGSRWHKVFWTGGAAPAVNVQHNKRYFMDSRAVWNYNDALVPTAAEIAVNKAQLQEVQTSQAYLGPMANLLIQADFPGTGGRPDLGPMPKWHAMHLLSQDKDMRDIVLVLADAMAGCTAHYRNEATDLPVTVADYPGIYTMQSASSTPPIPVRGVSSTLLDPVQWAPDTAHQGQFSYYPYLLTGDLFYLEELQFWAAWCIHSMVPSYRDNGMGHVRREQPRGQAWTMRTIGHAQRISPDGDPLKPHFKQMLDNNLAWYADNYKVGTTTPDISPFGMIPQSSTRVAPWQNDFFVICLSLIVENGDGGANAQHILDWVSRFTVGRLTSPDFCFKQAAGYYWDIRNGSLGTEPFLDNWADFYARNMPGLAGVPFENVPVEGYPSGMDYYNVYACAMLGATANAGNPQSAAALAQYRPLIGLTDTNWAKAPTWAIVPRT